MPGVRLTRSLSVSAEQVVLRRALRLVASSDPAFRIGRGFWKGGDGALIDGVGPNGVAAATVDIARRAAKLQSGYVYHYAFAMLLGVCALVTWYIVWLGLERGP